MHPLQERVARITCGFLVGLVFLLAPMPGRSNPPASRDLQVGDVIAGWELVRTMCHPEFCRYHFERDGQTVGVEATAFRDPEPTVIVQAMPGGVHVPPDLLEGVQQWAIAFEQANGAPIAERLGPTDPGADSRPGAPNKSFVRFTPYASVALVVLLAALVGLAARDWRRRENGRTEAQAIALSLSVAISAFVALLHTSTPVPLHNDTINDLLVARDCIAGLECTYGVLTSFEGYFQGTAWVRLLALCLSFGMDIAQIQILVLVFHAMSIAVVFAMARRVSGPSVGLLAAAVSLFFARGSVEADVLWNPSLLPLPVAAAHVMLLVYLRTGKTRFLVWSSLFTALVIDSHTAGLAIVPALVVFGVLHGPRPLVGFLAALSFVLPLAILSPDSFAHNTALVANWVGWPGAVSGFALAGVSAYLLRKWWRGQSLGAHLTVACFVLVGPFAGAAIVLMVSDHVVIWRYFTPLLPTLSVAVAVVVGACVAVLVPADKNRQALWICSPALVLLGTFFAGVAQHRPEGRGSSWSMDEIETLTEHIFDGNSLGLPDLVATVHGPEGWTVVQGLAALAPIRDEVISSPPNRAVYLVRTPTDRLRTPYPEGWSVIPLSRDVAVVRSSIQPFVRQERPVTVCHDVTGESWQCFEVDRSNYRDPAVRGFLRHRCFLHMPGMRMIPLEPSRSVEMRYTISAPEAGWRLVQTETARGQTIDQCSPLISEVHGVEYRGDLPDHSVWVFAPEPGIEGSLVVTARSGVECAPLDRLPEVFESGTGDQAWRDLTGLVTPGTREE